jgi:hypothetical protein
MQKELGSTHSLDRCSLTLVRAFGNINLIATANLISLHIQGNRTIGGSIAFTT